ncbi:MAG: hypothetical protein NZ942_01615 [Candidatus Aenigmarchaeota archaeon]|nr:hypothetical protein [Candidatus Aenigmarchaeota archaeon]
MSLIDPIFERIILKLDEKEILTRDELAKLIEPCVDFKYLTPERKREVVYREIKFYSYLLERCGYSIRFSHRGRDYTLQITEKGKEVAKKLRVRK